MSAINAKKIILVTLVLSALVSLVIVLQFSERRRSSTALARRITEMSPGRSTPRTVEGLRQSIARHEAQIARHVRDAAQTGVYWKILGIRLADGGMHRDALAAFERAIDFNAEDPILFYLAGISAGIVAKSIIGISASVLDEREHFFRVAETAHRRALELDSQYLRPMYALGVLYAFDLNRPQEAIPLLETYLRAMPNDIPAMFILARAHFMTESFDRALELYERIMTRTRDENVRRQAQINRELVWEHMF